MGLYPARCVGAWRFAGFREAGEGFPDRGTVITHAARTVIRHFSRKGYALDLSASRTRVPVRKSALRTVPENCPCELPKTGPREPISAVHACAGQKDRCRSCP